jgi:hypothetical protein
VLESISGTKPKRRSAPSGAAGRSRREGHHAADAKDRIGRFVEKPGDTPLLDELREPGPGPCATSPAWASTSSTRTCSWNCWTTDAKDFGKNIIPAAIQNRAVYRYCSTATGANRNDPRVLGSEHGTAEPHAAVQPSTTSTRRSTPTASTAAVEITTVAT